MAERDASLQAPSMQVESGQQEELHHCAALVARGGCRGLLVAEEQLPRLGPTLGSISGFYAESRMPRLTEEVDASRCRCFLERD